MKRMYNLAMLCTGFQLVEAVDMHTRSYVRGLGRFESNRAVINQSEKSPVYSDAYVCGLY